MGGATTLGGNGGGAGGCCCIIISAGDVDGGEVDCIMVARCVVLPMRYDKEE